MTQEKRSIPPLDAAALERLGLRYVERFATTRGRLVDYLRRKIRERGWQGETAADPVGLAQRMADLGYIDDLAYAEAKAAAMGRRGLGARRVTMALRQAHIEEPDAEQVVPAVVDRAIETALAFARRRRLGPFGTGSVEGGSVEDHAVRQKQLAAMLRAGHGFELSRRIVEASEQIGPEDLA